MAKGQYLSNYQQGIVKRYYGNQDTLVVTKLAELSSELYLCDDPKKAATLWKSVQTALKKTSLDPLKAARIVNEKRVEDLAKLVQELSAPGAKVLAEKSPMDTQRPSAAGAGATVPGTAQAGSAQAGSAQAGSALAGSAQAASASPAVSTPTTGSPMAAAVSRAADAPPSPEQLKAALKAFKKRLKLTRLDEESKISNRALTGGKKSSVSAIQPPNDYPRVYWDALVKEGHLRYIGSGMYELLDEQAG